MLFTLKCLKFVTPDYILCDLWLKQIFRLAAEQTLICRIKTILTMVSQGKKNVSFEKKNVCMKIGEVV